MPNFNHKTANSIASYFGGTPTPDAEGASKDNSEFHQDLSSTICPTCHDKVKQAIPQTPPAPSQEEVFKQYDADKAQQAKDLAERQANAAPAQEPSSQ